MREITRTWRDLFLGFRIALDLRKMFLGLLALFTTALVVVAVLFVLMWGHADEQNRRLAEAQSVAAETRQADLSEVWVDCGGRSLMAIATGALSDAGEHEDVLRPEHDDVSVLANLVWLTLADYGLVTFRHPATGDVLQPRGIGILDGALLILAGLVWWAFLSRQLGAISRIAAVEVSRDVRIEMGKAMAFARSRARPLFMAPILIDIVFLLLCAAIGVWALVGMIPGVGPALAAITAPAAIFGGFLMAVLIIGGVLGFPLLVPALAVEGTDSFDALSRAYSFVYSRPWHYLFYNLVGLIYGAICVAFVFAFTLLMLALAAMPARAVWGEPFNRFMSFVLPSDTLWSLMTFGSERALNESNIGTILATDGVPGLIFTVLMLLFLIFILGLMLAYVVSYLVTMWTLIYYAMRSRVDGTDPTEIFYDEDDDLWMAPPPEVEQAVAATAAAAAVKGN